MVLSYKCELCGHEFDYSPCKCKIINAGRTTIVCKGCCLGGDRGCGHTLNDCDQIYGMYREAYHNQDNKTIEELKAPKYTCKICGQAIEFQDWILDDRTCGSHDDKPPTIPKSHEDIEELKQEAMLIIQDGKVIPFAKRVLNKLHAGDDIVKLKNFLCCLSAGLPEKHRLHSLDVGKSQHGKSHVQRLQKYIFQNYWIDADSFSPKDPYYEAKKDPDVFKHKVLFADDLNQLNKEVLDIIKKMTDGDRDSVTHRVVNTKTKDAEILTIDGLPSVLANTCEVPEEEQNANRLLIGNIDESEQQAERVRKWQIEKETNAWNPDHDKDIQTLKLIVSEIFKEHPTIKIPFIDRIDFMTKGQYNLYNMFIKLIKVITYANRHIRENNDNTVLSIEEDFNIAKKIFTDLYKYQIAQVNNSTIEVVEFLDHEIPKSVSEVSKHFKISDTATRKRLQRAHNAGLARWEYQTGVVDYHGHEREVKAKEKIWYKDQYFNPQEIKLLDNAWKPKLLLEQDKLLSNEPV